MAGTKLGGQRAAAANIAKYGKDFYAKIGAIGGRLGHTGGFAHVGRGVDGLTGPERASKVGSIGGSISRRPKGVKHGA